MARGPREWAAAAAGAAEGECEDEVYTPFVPTAPDQVERVLTLARVTAADRLCDLGFGEGALLIDAIQRTNCSGVGVEINGRMVESARAAATRVGLLAPQLVLTEGLIDAFLRSPQFDDVTLVFVFLVPQHLAQILPALRAFLRRPGARIVSERYEIKGLRKTGQLEAAGSQADSNGSGGANSGAGEEVDGAALRSSYFGRSNAAYLYEGER